MPAGKIVRTLAPHTPQLLAAFGNIIGAGPHGMVGATRHSLNFFGTCVGDAITDRIHEALQSAEGGLSRVQIRSLFQGHISSSSIQEALERLNHLGAVSSRQVSGRGRPVTVWSAVDPSAPWQEETSQPGESFGEQILDSILKSIWTT